MTKLQLRFASAFPLPTGKLNQWKRDTKGTHKRRIPAQTPPFKGSIRESIRNKRTQVVFDEMKARTTAKRSIRNGRKVS
jgi:hypothetical protein